MYELKTAFSYLVPRKGQLSISVVGSIAVLVILAIAWLVLVFFSTTEGFERRWSAKITSILGPLQIVPTKEYFDSPIYQIDLFSEDTERTPQRLSTKLSSPALPLNENLPPSLASWHKAHKTDSHPIFSLSQKLDAKKIPWRSFESTVSHLSISSLQSIPSQTLSQYASLLGLSSLNIEKLDLVPEISATEVSALLQIASNPKTKGVATAFINALEKIDIITTAPIEIEEKTIPIATRATISLSYEEGALIAHFTQPFSLSIPVTHSLFSVLNVSLHHAPLLLDSPSLPYVSTLGYPVLLSKYMRKQGVRLLDRGTFEVSGSSLSGPPLTIPFYVAGFFDPGILPIGSRLAITSTQAVHAIQPELSSEGPLASSGLIIDLPREQLPSFQKKIENDITPLFTTKRYDQYEVTAELYHQLRSEKTLFRLISCIIIAVACSNIFSMLFILAHDRRKEIAVLRALGATKKSIAAIFIIAGLMVGLLGSLLGSFLAAITLHYLPELLAFLGRVQGQELLQQTIYGDIQAQTLSLPTFLFTVISISVTSAIAGGLAAFRACRINVSQALRG